MSPTSAATRAFVRALVLAPLLVCALPRLAAAQAMSGTHDMSTMARGWSWRLDADAFLSANLQQRVFRSFHQVESPNWFMVSGHHQNGRLTVMLHGMVSFEPFTFRKLGSAEVFQTGETDAQGLPLIDYQHPHDLLMGASLMLQWRLASATQLTLEAAPVGSPALGPLAFMHRASAESNSTAPLGHHHLDSTHITHGVVTAGLSRGDWQVEASVFHGREPDAHRIRLDFGPLDSYAARLTWHRSGWQAQVSGGHLTFPDPTEFTDLNRLTASATYEGRWRGREIAATAAWGLNHETALGVTSPAWLIEAAGHVSARDLVYARGELVDQDILTAGGYEPPGLHLPHALSRVGAWTMGYARALGGAAAGDLSVGADITLYRTPRNLLDSYGHPLSVHVYLRYRLPPDKSVQK